MTERGGWCKRMGYERKFDKEGEYYGKERKTEY